MKKFFSLLLILVFFSSVFPQSENPAQVKPIPPEFVSDGCSLFPDSNYRQCCESHDLDYFYGGSWKQRWRSDKRLYNCVKNKGGFKNKIIAPLMWVGVRIGGVPFLPTPFRWGFGKSKLKTQSANTQNLNK